MTAPQPIPMPDRTHLADLFRALHGAVYPARPRQLAALVRARQGSDALVRALDALPDHPIVGPNQVCAALFGPHHGPTQSSP